MWGIVLLTSATVVFRCDILVLLGPFTLQLLLAKEVCLFPLIIVVCCTYD